MSNNIYNDLLKNQPANYLSQALSDGKIKTLGDSLSSGYFSIKNGIQNNLKSQVETFKEFSNQINTHSAPIVWVIIFILFFIVIII
jgi:hypothetical protein